ncbi:MAG TPA: SCO family protein [Bacteroidales bacterium]|nr:SCO family protein [Bacteroidales bacterium]
MKKITALVILLSGAALAHGQNFVKDNDLSKQVEIGIVEKLGDTIPLNLTFSDENGDKIVLGQLISKPTILCFVYYDCPGICPALQTGVAEVISHLDLKLGKDYQVVAISFNPADTPERAREVKSNYVQKISEEQRKDWHYLTGTQENITAITTAVGYHYIVQGMGFAHPSAIMIVSPHGKITRYLYGVSYLPFDVKMALFESQKGLSRPTINKVMELCFAYDPQSKTYSLQVTRIAGILILFCAIVILGILFLKGRMKSKK